MRTKGKGKIRGRKCVRSLGRRKMAIVAASMVLIVAIPAILFIDFDGDGLSNVTELRLGTGALNSDTDGDGLNDGVEVNTYKIDPLNSDTDGDNLNDGVEVNTYETDPLNPDTDGDNLSDGLEVGTYGSDPLAADTDGDGLGDWQEASVYGTSLVDNDTDDDGLSDGQEVSGWSITVNGQTKHVTSDPHLADSDEDQLDDPVEHDLLTDPSENDTDNDGLGDWLEADRGLDPKNSVETYLNIPFYSQLSGECWETSLQMAFAYCEIYESAENIRVEGGGKAVDENYWAMWGLKADEAGYSSPMENKPPEGERKEIASEFIVDQISKGRPIIASWWKPGGHIVVVSGFTDDGDTIIIHDPAQEPYLTMTLDDFVVTRELHLLRGLYKGDEEPTVVIYK